MSDEELVAHLRLNPDELVAREHAEPEQLQGTPERRRLKREVEPFVHVTVRDLLAGAAVLDGTQELLVWLFILRERLWRRSAHQSETFALTNAGLRTWGVTRCTKARALRKLVAAGLIRIDKHGQRSPRVSVC